MRPPTITDRKPVAIEVEAGKTYLWCACGRSQRQPFCDSSHAGSGHGPVRYLAERTGTVYFCLCKHSRKRPLCDGAHNRLPPPEPRQDL